MYFGYSKQQRNSLNTCTLCVITNARTCFICLFHIQSTHSTNILHYITYYKLFKEALINFKDHYGEAVKEQCLGEIAEIDVFPVSDEMLSVTRQTGRRRVNCSRA